MKRMATAALTALVALALWGTYAADPSRIVLDAAVAVIACGLIPVTLRRPIGGGLILSVLGALSYAATPTASFATLYAARVRPFRQAVMVALTGIAAQAVLGLWRPAGGLSYGWWLLLMAAAYAALLGWGALAQSRQALLCELRERARRAEEDQSRRIEEARVAERQRIAREMHDVLAHRLSLVAAYAGALAYRPDSSPQQLSKAAGVVRDGISQALDELRQVIVVVGEEDGGLPDVTDIPGLVQEVRDAGTDVDLTAPVSDVPPVQGRAAYRIVQEGLTNARKHAPGRPVAVLLSGGPGEGLTVEVRNPASARTDPEKLGLGLAGLTERVRLAGGTLEHARTADGFRLAARLPWPA